MSPELRPVRVWDLPTRLFHWTLVVCVLGSVVTAKVGGNLMAWHFRFGYVIFTLLLFRLVWGFVGGRWSRFASFVRSPATILRYLRGQTDPSDAAEVGHNPLGALSVLAVLGLLAAQVGAGLFADDEIASSGPLVVLVSGATSSLLTSLHKTYGQWLIIGLVLLHVGAILFYRFKKKQDLIAPMLSGDKQLPSATPASADSPVHRLVAAAVLAACALGVAWVIQLGSGAPGV